MTERERVDNFVSGMNGLQAEYGVSIGYNIETCHLVAYPDGSKDEPSVLTVIAIPNYYHPDRVEYALLDQSEMAQKRELLALGHSVQLCDRERET